MSYLLSSGSSERLQKSFVSKHFLRGKSHSCTAYKSQRLLLYPLALETLGKDCPLQIDPPMLASFICTTRSQPSPTANKGTRRQPTIEARGDSKPLSLAYMYCGQ
jgi:hypothetical protein